MSDSDACSFGTMFVFVFVSYMFCFFNSQTWHTGCYSLKMKRPPEVSCVWEVAGSWGAVLRVDSSTGEVSSWVCCWRWGLAEEITVGITWQGKSCSCSSLLTLVPGHYAFLYWGNQSEALPLSQNKARSCELWVRVLCLSDDDKVTKTPGKRITVDRTLMMWWSLREKKGSTVLWESLSLLVSLLFGTRNFLVFPPHVGPGG